MFILLAARGEGRGKVRYECFGEAIGKRGNGGRRVYSFWEGHEKLKDAKASMGVGFKF